MSLRAAKIIRNLSFEELRDSSVFSAESSHFVSTEVNFLKTCPYVRTWLTYLDLNIYAKGHTNYYLNSKKQFILCHGAHWDKLFSTPHHWSSSHRVAKDWAPLLGWHEILHSTGTWTFCLNLILNVRNPSITLKFIALTVTEEGPAVLHTVSCSFATS